MTPSQRKQLSTLLIIVGFLCGALTVWQFKSFGIAESAIRDSDANNIFREVQVLKLTNDELKQEIEELTLQLESLTDGHSYRESIRKELEKNQLISGLTPIEGPGITLILDKPVAVSWIVDTLNELWTAGAEAIAINGIRLSPYTVGFEDFNGQIYLNKVPLRTPYKIESVGNTDILEKILSQQGSITARLKTAYPGIQINIKTEELIQMEAVR